MKLKKIKLGDYLEYISDYHANGSYKSLKRNISFKRKRNYAAVIRTLNFERQDFQNDLLYIDKREYEYLSKSKVYPDDILMNKIADAGSVYIMPNLGIPVSCGMNLFLIRFNNLANQRYMYYNMKNVEDYIKSFSHGTTTKTITKDEVREIELQIPDKKEQDKIANLLTDIDKTIANNNAISKEFESMAKTIYDYWFLQFEFPDKDGKPYKSNGGKMVWNDQLKQEIPEGWKVKKIQDLAQFGNGINYSKDINGDKSYKIVNVRDITSSSLVINDHDLTKIAIPNKNINKYFVNKNDILIARSGTPGAVRILTSTKEKILFAGFIIHCLPNDPALRWYLTYSLKELEGTNATTTGGSILQNVSQTTLKSILIILPPDSLIEKFNQQLTSIVKCLQNNIKENQQLKSLRDFLLPLLMNGQVTIED